MRNTAPRQISLLGATGSIGRSALDVIARHPERFRVHALAAGRNVDALIAQCHAHRPRHAVIADPTLYPRLRAGLAGLPVEAHAGDTMLDDIARDPACDTVIAAIVGAAGLSSTLAAAEAGKRLLLANKESLVMAGELVMTAAAHAGAEIIPIDSEHNAVFQCINTLAARPAPLLPRPPGEGARTERSDIPNNVRFTAGEGVGTRADAMSDIHRITLTASGGPFRGRSRAELTTITPAQALAHPTWSMGAKISIDSATLMNKGLELIEAHHLFGLPSAQLDVLVHPQSLVHALVDFIDGSTLAQLGLPDMRTALSIGLGWPERIASGVSGLDLLRHRRLEFEPPDLETFPCLALARHALETGGTAPAILNAANEVAVTAFLQEKIPFLSIARLVEQTLNTVVAEPAASLQVLREADAAARREAEVLLRNWSLGDDG